LDRKRVDGKFLGPGGSVPASLLEECFEVAEEIRAQEDARSVGESLKPIYDRLSALRQELESLAMTHRWSLRETDLWNYSLSLQEIDRMRVDGKFVDAEGNRPRGQYVSLLGTLILNTSLICNSIQGLAISPPALLWPDLPIVVIKRTSFRGADANRTPKYV
jgi:hypothetical protein